MDVLLRVMQGHGGDTRTGVTGARAPDETSPRGRSGQGARREIDAARNRWCLLSWRAMALDRTGTATPSRIEGFDRAVPVWLLAAGALLLLILLPLGWLAYMSVSGERGLTLAHYARVFTDPRLGRALWNTVVLAFWSGLLSLAIGAPMAWLTARTDLPGPRLMRSLVMASFVTPPFLGAFAWVMLAGPNAGYLNKLYRSLTGSPDPLVNIFTMPGLIFVVALYTFPFAYIMVANTLELIASDMEEAAAILGASRVWVALTITLPMVLPAILSGFILSVLQALALFGSPAILALPAGFHTITTQIWALFQYPPKMEMAAAFSMPLLLATALAALRAEADSRPPGLCGGGRQGRPAPAHPARAVALSRARRLPRGHGLRRLPAVRHARQGRLRPRVGPAPDRGERHPRQLVARVHVDVHAGRHRQYARAGPAHGLRRRGARRAARVRHQPEADRGPPDPGLPGAHAGGDPGRGPRRRALHRLHAAAVPALRHAVDLVPGLSHQGDARRLLAVRRDVPRIHPELEDAGRILGAGRLTVLRDITAPLARSGIIAAWCFVFIGVIRELSASILLFTPNTKVMSVVIFDLKEEGEFGAIAVLGLFMLAMTFATVLTMQGLLGRDVLGARPSSGGSG